MQEALTYVTRLFGHLQEQAKSLSSESALHTLSYIVGALNLT